MADRESTSPSLMKGDMLVPFAWNLNSRPFPMTARISSASSSLEGCSSPFCLMTGWVSCMRHFPYYAPTEKLSYLPERPLPVQHLPDGLPCDVSGLYILGRRVDTIQPDFRCHDAIPLIDSRGRILRHRF